MECFRGDAEDVARRALACCTKFKLDTFIRICGDSPFIDHNVILDLCDLYEKNRGLDIATNLFPRTFPPGISAEILSTDALHRAMSMMDQAGDREHVTPVFYRNPNHFNIANLQGALDEGDPAAVSLAVDTPKDLEKAIWIVKHLGGNPELATLKTVIGLARQHQDKELKVS